MSGLLRMAGGDVGLRPFGLVRGRHAPARSGRGASVLPRSGLVELAVTDDARVDDSVELVTDHAVGERAEVAPPIVRGAEVELEGEAPRGEVGLDLFGVESEGHGLAGSAEGGQDALGPGVATGVVQDLAVDVGEHEVAPRR